MSLADTIALTTLAIAKDELGITGSDDDTRLERMIRQASQAILSYLGRSLRKETVTAEKVRPTDACKILLARPPIVSVTLIEIDDSEVESDDYVIDNADAGILYRENGWSGRNVGVSGSASADVIPGTDRRRIEVTYVGGYVLPNDSTGTRNLPEDIEQACLMTVASLYRSRGRDRNVSGESLGDYSVSYRNPNSAIGIGTAGIIPQEAVPMLDRYRHNN